MPFKVVFTPEELKEELVNTGWDDVVIGAHSNYPVRKFITWSSGMSRIPRLGYYFIPSFYFFYAHGITATSHTEGSEPSGWSIIYSSNARINCYGGMVVYHYPNEVIALTSLYSGQYSGCCLFAKTYDPVTGEFTGWYSVMSGGYFNYEYTFGLSQTYQVGLFTVPTTYISKFAVIRPHAYTGVVRGILYDQGTFGTGYKIGDEKFVRLRGGILVKV